MNSVEEQIKTCTVGRCFIHWYKRITVKAFRLIVAQPPSGPTMVVILVVDYISEQTIHSLYVHPFCVKEMFNTSFIVNFIQHSRNRRI